MGGVPDDSDLARALSALATPNFFVWSTNADVQAVRAAVLWANLTPADVPDGTQQWANRSLQCQGKQFNVQMLIPYTGTINGSLQAIRDGLQDALSGVRSGAGGTSQGAGWSAVQGALSRRAKYIEKIWSDTTNGDGSTKSLSALMVYEGNALPADVEAARNLA